MGHTVRTVVKLSGLSSHTLRAWERRYQVIKPSRTASGQRLYTSIEIDRLIKLRQLTEFGYPISRLSKMTDIAINELIASRQTIEVRNEGIVEGLEYLRLYQFDLLERYLNRMRMNMSVRNFIFEIVCPMFVKLDSLVVSQELSIAQEHMFSSILRNQLGEIMGLVQRSNVVSQSKRKFLFTTPSGNLHEFGILISAILASEKGHMTNYLGPNMPSCDLAKTIASMNCTDLVLGIIHIDNALKKYLMELLNHLKLKVNWPVRIWLGGGGRSSIDLGAISDDSIKVVQMNTIKQFEEEVIKTSV